jgi:hypothetical protein
VGFEKQKKEKKEESRRREKHVGKDNLAIIGKSERRTAARERIFEAIL